MEQALEFISIFLFLSVPVVLIWLFRQSDKFYRMVLGALGVATLLSILTSTGFGVLYSWNIAGDVTHISLLFSTFGAVLAFLLALKKLRKRDWSQVLILGIIVLINVYVGYWELWAMAALGMGI